MNPKPSLKPSESLDNILKNKLLELSQVEQKIETITKASKSIDAQLELAVVEGKIKVAESQLKKIHNSITRAKDNLQKLQMEVRGFGLAKTQILNDIKRVKNQLANTIRDAKDKEDALRFEIRSLEQEKIDRKDYLEAQEAQINSLVDDGNIKLRSLKYEIDDLENHKQDIINQEFQANESLRIAQQELSSFIAEAENIKSNHSESIELLVKEIESLLVKIGDARLENQAVTKDTEEKLSKLKEKEESILAKEQANRLKDEELARRERRLSTTEHLYQ